MQNDIDFLMLINASLVQGKTATAVVAFTSLEHRDIYKLRYCIRWSDATGAEVIQIQVGVTGGTPVPVTYPVLGTDGDPVTIGRLRRRELLCLRFVSPNTAAVSPHFVLLNQLCPQIIVTPEIKDPLVQTTSPTVDPILAAATTVTGTGTPGAVVTVTFPNGTTASTIVNAAGDWTVPVPSTVTLVTGNTVSATQLASGQTVSTPVTVTV